MKDNIILGITLAQTAALISILLMTSCSYLNQQMGEPDDWWGEELLEVAIKAETGISVDLTPGTPE